MRRRLVEFRWLGALGLMSLVGLPTGTTRAGTLYVADLGTGQVDAVNSSGSVSTFASVVNALGLAVDSAGNLYASEYSDGTVVKITPAGSVSTFFSGYLPGPGDIYPEGLAVDGSGNVYVGDVYGNVSRITPGGSISTFATNLAYGELTSLAFDKAGNLYADGDGGIDKITPGGVASTFAPGIYGYGLAFDGAGNLYASEYLGGALGTVIYEITPGGVVSTFASGLVGSGEGLAFDSSGNLYVAIDSESANSGWIDKITPSGTVSTFATGLIDPRGLVFSPQSVPEPSSLIHGMIGLGLLWGYVASRQRRALAARRSRP